MAENASTEDIPSLELLRRLQLSRTVLSRFLENDNFPEMITGCYVRVLLELRTDDSTAIQDASDRYFIASVKGARQGEVYTGFTSDGSTTTWYVVIDLPPCFNPGSNADIVQLNSVSNSLFRPADYQQWVDITRQYNLRFPTGPSLAFRHSTLLRDMAEKARLSVHNIEPAVRKQIEEEVRSESVLFPSTNALRAMKLEELEDVERHVLDLITSVRVEINERFKCLVCRVAFCTEICYPCKHQVLCKSCAAHIDGVCPAPGCTTPVRETFEPFSS
eukprot:gene12108-8332_t